MKILSFVSCVGLALLGSVACGKFEPESNAVGGAGSASNGGSRSTTDAGNGGLGEASSGTAGAPSDTGFQQCTPGNTTTISGVVYDPAGKNPLYNVAVYVPDPSSPLPDLESIPLGCGCAQLLPEKALAVGAPTDASGHFEIPCAPSGTVSLVVQTGKWRRQYDGVEVVANQPNVIPNLRLPANSSEGSLPNIAISTGGAESIECLPLRFGVSASEYVAGSATGGHIHIYTGLRGATPARGTVRSRDTLWDSQAHLNEHDVVLLACEGEATKGGEGGERVGAAAQEYLLNYANAGGRVFASHHQLAWFDTGPFESGAKWLPGDATLDDARAFPAEINTGLGAQFAERSALAEWLGAVSALTDKQLPLWFVHTNVRALAQPPSTEWIRLVESLPEVPAAPQLFSVDMPIGESGRAVCGRVVYTSLHVSGGPNTNAPGVPVDYPSADGSGPRPPGGVTQGGSVPAGCAMHPLTPQEAALEFMFFDQGSCLVTLGEEPAPP